MALLMLIAGAVAVVAGTAMLSIAAAVIVGGSLLIACSVAVAAVQDRLATHRRVATAAVAE